MQKSNEDCYYFLTSTCTKGIACPYRHNPAAIACNVICSAWLRGNCLDPVCGFRHSSIQRPVPTTNGILCFYDKTPTGCLKPDCTFFHSRPRTNLRIPSNFRPSTTNLVNNNLTKTPASPTTTLPVITNEPTVPVATPQVEVSPIPENPPPPVKEKTPPKPEPIVEKVEIPVRSVISSSLETKPEEKKSTPTAPSRFVSTRNVVVAESTNGSNRTIVQSSSNRVVVSSNNKSKTITIDDSDSDIDLDDLMEQDNHVKKPNTKIDISFPCSAPLMTGRLFMPSKVASSSPSTTSDTKPIRLNRARLPAPKISYTNSSNSLSTPSNGKQTSAGTGLSDDDERRSNRLERFKRKSDSPPPTTGNSSFSTANHNERKRPVNPQSLDDSPPSKRSSISSSQQESNHHRKMATIGDLCSPPSSPPHRSLNPHHHRRRSSPSRSLSISSTMNKSNWDQAVDAFLAETSKPKKPVPLLSIRPNYVPPSVIKAPQPRPTAPIIKQQPPLPDKPSIQAPSPVNIVKKPISPPPRVPSPVPVPTTKVSNEEDENQLLDLDEPSDVVDTFALIDEALLDADHLLDLV